MYSISKYLHFVYLLNTHRGTDGMALIHRLVAIAQSVVPQRALIRKLDRAQTGPILETLQFAGWLARSALAMAANKTFCWRHYIFIRRIASLRDNRKPGTCYSNAMSSLKAALENRGDLLRVTLSGVIDERSELTTVFAEISQETILDLSGVERLNSIGILRWVPAIEALSQRQKVRIEAISYAFALQANCVANLFGQAHVVSCMAPYFCAKCGGNQMVLVTRDELSEGAAVPQKGPCIACGNDQLEFDELDSYFAFFEID